MTELLQRALDEIRKLSEEQQDELANWILEKISESSPKTLMITHIPKAGLISIIDRKDIDGKDKMTILNKKIAHSFL